MDKSDFRLREAFVGELPAQVRNSNVPEYLQKLGTKDKCVCAREELMEEPQSPAETQYYISQQNGNRNHKSKTKPRSQ